MRRPGAAQPRRHDDPHRPRRRPRLRRWCAETAGLTLGIALTVEGEDEDSIFRIGHMGHLDPPMLLGTLATIEAGLPALGIPHRAGGAAAAAAEVAAAARGPEGAGDSPALKRGTAGRRRRRRGGGCDAWTRAGDHVRNRDAAAGSGRQAERPGEERLQHGGNR